MIDAEWLNQNTWYSFSVVPLLIIIAVAVVARLTGSAFTAVAICANPISIFALFCISVAPAVFAGVAFAYAALFFLARSIAKARGEK